MRGKGPASDMPLCRGMACLPCIMFKYRNLEGQPASRGMTSGWGHHPHVADFHPFKQRRTGSIAGVSDRCVSAFRLTNAGRLETLGSPAVTGGPRSGRFIHFGLYLYDPSVWTRAAKDAGMKYFVITTKHHDGFCL